LERPSASAPTEASAGARAGGELRREGVGGHADDHVVLFGALQQVGGQQLGLRAEGEGVVGAPELQVELGVQDRQVDAARGLAGQQRLAVQEEAAVGLEAGPQRQQGVGVLRQVAQAQRGHVWPEHGGLQRQPGGQRLQHLQHQVHHVGGDDVARPDARQGRDHLRRGRRAAPASAGLQDAGLEDAGVQRKVAWPDEVGVQGEAAGPGEAGVGSRQRVAQNLHHGGIGPPLGGQETGHVLCHGRSSCGIVTTG
jgi:hypothetical protein